MNDFFSKMIATACVSALILPASTFAQAPSLEHQLETQVSRTDRVTQQMEAGGIRFSATPSVTGRDLLHAKQISQQIRSGTAKVFYVLTPQDPALNNASLGLKVELIKETADAEVLRVEMLKLNPALHQLQPFSAPALKRTIQINFASTDGALLKLSTDQALRTMYIQARDELQESMTSVEKLKLKTLSLAGSLFMPNAQAELVSEIFSNVVYWSLMVVVLGSGVRAVMKAYEFYEAGSGFTQKKQLIVAAAITISSILILSVIEGFKNQNTYGHDGGDQ